MPSLPAGTEKTYVQATEKWALPAWSLATPVAGTLALVTAMCLSGAAAGMTGDAPIRYSTPEPPGKPPGQAAASTFALALDSAAAAAGLTQLADSVHGWRVHFAVPPPKAP